MILAFNVGCNVALTSMQTLSTISPFGIDVKPHSKHVNFIDLYHVDVYWKQMSPPLTLMTKGDSPYRVSMHKT